jgi:polyketide cyclase/dehydrase/lipid transport protein
VKRSRSAAAATVAATPASVFAFLAELRNHWRLAGRTVRLEQLDRPDEAHPDEAWIRVRSPLGISRRVHTRIVRSTAPADGVGGVLEGEAEASNGTAATVVWRMSAVPEGTRVSLEAVIERAARVDRLLLAVGGRRWLESALLREAVESLEQAIDGQRR